MDPAPRQMNVAIRHGSGWYSSMEVWGRATACDTMGTWNALTLHNIHIVDPHLTSLDEANMRNLFLASLLSFLAATFPSVAGSLQQSTAHSFSFANPAGGQINLADYAGQAILVVNTASQCSFTEQYGPLQALYEKYRDRGLVVVGVPSNDFGRQEPGSDAEIAEFTSTEFQVDFPITGKTRVKGGNANSFYKWAAEQVGALGKPRWNFHKYLVGPDGQIVTWFSTVTEPDSARLANAIEEALPTAYSAPEE